MNYSEIIDEIVSIVKREEPILRSLPEDVISTRFNHQNRSIKMLLGHQVTLNDMILGYTGHLKLHIGHIHELMEE
ncbi:MAG: hypothetical protein ACI3Y4_01920 [Candidatus Cryptobacteroides sp.]